MRIHLIQVGGSGEVDKIRAVRVDLEKLPVKTVTRSAIGFEQDLIGDTT